MINNFLLLAKTLRKSQIKYEKTNKPLDYKRKKIIEASFDKELEKLILKYNANMLKNIKACNNELFDINVDENEKK